jgi:hypothetical protein
MTDLASVPDFESVPLDAYHAPLNTWPEAVDLFKPVKLPELRQEWLPPVIADFAFDQAEVIGCDPAILAQACIGACASAVHDGIQLQPHEFNYGWTESARLWTAIIGDPSSKKSPALSRATSPLRKIDMRLFEIEQAAKAKHKRDLKIYESMERTYIAAQSKRELGSEPIPPEEPQVDRMIVEDTTVEALSEILKNSQRGVMVMADELAGWLGSMDAYKAKGANADRAHWLQIYNGGARRIDRISRGNLMVKNWSASIVGGIQPDVMRKIFKSMPEDGLLQRFIPIVAKDGTPGASRPPTGRVIASYGDLVERLYSLQPNGHHLRLSPEAEEIHKSIVAYYYEIRELAYFSPAMLSWMGKWEGLSPRLMLTFHLIECCSAGENYDRPVSEATAERVLYYMKEFLFRHAMVFYEETITESSTSEAVRWIGGYILAHQKQTLANRDLLRAYGWWESAQDDQRQRVMARLSDFGWIEPKEQNKDRFKALPSQWTVNPNVHEIYRMKAAQERTRRERTIELIRQNGENR